MADTLRDVKNISRAAGKLLKMATKHYKPKKRRRKPKRRRMTEEEKQAAKRLRYQKQSAKNIGKRLNYLENVRFEIPEKYRKEIEKIQQRKKAMSEEKWDEWLTRNGNKAINSTPFKVDVIRTANGTIPVPDEMETQLTAQNFTTPAGVVKGFNKLRATKMPVQDFTQPANADGTHPMTMRHILTHEEGSILGELLTTILQDTGATSLDLVAGMANEYFEIDTDYNPDKPYTISDHLKLKKLPAWKTDEENPYAELLADYARLVYTDRNLFEEYMRRRQRRAGDKILDDLGVDEQTRAILSMILNSSQIYAIASREAPPSEAAEAAYKHLTEICEEAQRTSMSIFMRIVAMIMNDEDYDDIAAEFNRLITELRQGQDVDSTSEG